MKKEKIFFMLCILSLSFMFMSSSVKADDNYEITVNPSSAGLGKYTKITIDVTDNLGVPQNGVLIGLDGCGVSTNGSSDSNGQILFSINPSSTGVINIYIGSETNIVTESITVSTWSLDVSSPASVNEGESFTVTVLKNSDSSPFEGATVMMAGIATYTTNSNGQVVVSAPQVSASLDYTISATADGYVSGSSTIRVIDVPMLLIMPPDNNVEAGSTFIISVYTNNGLAVVGTTVTFDGQTYITDISGEVSIVAPSIPDEYDITASHPGYIDSLETITIYPSNQVEVSHPKDDLEINEQFTIQVTSEEGLPIENATVYIQGKISSEVKTDSEGNAVITAPEDIGSFIVVIEGYNSDGDFFADTIVMSVGSSSSPGADDETKSDSDGEIGLEIFLILAVIIVFNVVIVTVFMLNKRKKTK